MGCPCKNVNKLVKKYGVEKKPRSVLKSKITNFVARVPIYIITVLLSIIIVPTVIVVGLFKTFFMKDKTLRLPKFLTSPIKNQ